jgi:serine/threonine protein kinase
LRELLAGQLVEAEQERLVAHVDSCPICQQTLAQLAAGTPGTILDLLQQPVAPLPDRLRSLRERPPTLSAPPIPGQEETEVGPGQATRPAPTSGGPPGYEILRELGRGGMGIVYLARDCKRKQVVALKTLQGMSPAALYRFKQEFRALADLAHPNLVVLHELGSDGRQWFFTMEFVEGVDFLTYVRSGAGAGTDEPGRPGLTTQQLQRLRQAFGQLAEGTTALHEAGILHRDIKPRNVLVTPAGRTVLLDFGLAAVLDSEGLHQSTEQHLVGTIAYMSPEQAAAQPLAPATDWYSLGAMLYEALTGRLPFAGSVLQVLRAKAEDEPPSPQQLWPAVPEDLGLLCVELLRRDPAARPSGRIVLQRLGSTPAEAGQPLPSPLSGRSSAPLIGRERHLDELAAAFATMKHGATVAVRLHGQSGTGKSTLLRCFLDGLIERGEAVVLQGRCYQQESMPYKALDSLVDALGRYLRRLPAHEVQALLPRDVIPLLRIFPVLQRVEGMAMSLRTVEIPDPHEVRRRAFAALRELLARLGDRKPLVLAIDDLQWGDIDSAVLLGDLLLPPDPPVLLLIGCYRSEDVQTSPFLRYFAELRSRGNWDLDSRELAVEPLSLPETEELARLLLGQEDPALQLHAGAISREAGGNPFFVCELVRHARTRQAAGPATAECLTLEEVIWDRARSLPEDVRRLLEVVAVAGQPLGQAEAAEAAGLAGAERSALAALRAARLIRAVGAAAQDDIETYHDRIRETIVNRLPVDVLREHHARLALTLERSSQTEPEVLAFHFLGAGESGRACAYYAVAAEQASGALAFDRAAKLYRLALELGNEPGPEERRLRRKLGDALASAGGGAAAAR